MRTGPGRPALAGGPVDAASWLLVAATGLVITAVAIARGGAIGVPGAPFTGDWRIKVEVGTFLAPTVALVTLAAIAAGLATRISWRALLLASWAASFAWTISLALVDGGNGLAGPVARADEYAADVAAVGSHPVDFIRTFVDNTDNYSVATRTHPPGPVLLLWALRQMGVTRALTLGVLLVLIGALTTPFVLVAVRSFAGELAARRLTPALVLAPYAVWVGVSMDGVVAALTAAFVATGVVASEPGRRPRWALAAGVLLGIATLFSYSAGWLGVIPLVVCYRRRRGRTIGLLGIGVLVPVGIARLMGFVWPDGLTAAQRDWSLRIGPNRSWALWAVLDVIVLVIACGPLIITALSRLRSSPAWPLVVGAVVGLAFAVGSGQARGEVERSWLPFFPWLLVPVVAPDRDGEPAEPSPLLIATGALAAVVLESVLRSAW